MRLVLFSGITETNSNNNNQFALILTKRWFLIKKKGLSNYLNMREPYLDSDYSKSIAKPATYDADLENFWTQSSTFILNRN